MASRKIIISHDIYGSKRSQENLDGDFKELQVKKYNVEEFFELYYQLFYEIEKKGKHSHTTIVNASTEYAGTPPNPKDLEIEDLKQQVQDLQWEIDSIEEEHPFLPNNSTVIQARTEPSLRYYMQSGRRRQIKSDEVFDLLKTRAGYTQDTPNEDFSVLLSMEAIQGILPGPDINSQEDLNIDIAYINRFTPGLNPNDPLDNINIYPQQPDLRVNSSIPETNNYNVMAHIEEPPLTPEGLSIPNISNTNSFNQNAASPLGTYEYNLDS